MDGVELRWHLFVQHGAQQQHGLKANPHPECKPHRTAPVVDFEADDKVREHKGDDEVPRELADQLRHRWSHLGHGARVEATHLHVHLAEQ